MSNYADLYNPNQTPQREQARPDQVANNEGGYVFALDPWKRLERFLILGSDAPTYYQKARALTRENAKIVEECWVSDPHRTAGLITGISTGGRAPKNDPAIFALALGTVSENVEARRWAYQSVRAVCRTGTHLFQFVATAMALGKGFGRGMKRAVGQWYTEKAVDKLAYQVIKYRQREGLTHENLLDLAHPNSGADLARSALFDWIIGKEVPADVCRHKLPDLVYAHLSAMKATTAAELLPILEECPDLPWEAMPTWVRADPQIQIALLPAMPLTALIRNLGNLTRIGVIAPLSDPESIVVDKLRDREALKRSRIHPMAVLTAMAVYGSGSGVRGEGSWSPSQKIMGALNRAFYDTFDNVVPSGKRFVIGIDVSGSMSSPISGSAALSCAEAAAAMALITARTEPKTFIGRFNNRFEPVRFDDDSRLDDVLRQTKNINYGGTDCAAAMMYALENGIEADVFVVITDNETHSGRIHPFESLKAYRRATGIPAKLVVIGMTSTGFTIADPSDGGMLDCVGFDTATPAVVSEFSRDR